MLLFSSGSVYLLAVTLRPIVEVINRRLLGDPVEGIQSLSYLT